MTAAGFSLVLAGLAVGAGLGVVLRTTRFCTLGAIADLILLRDARRFRSWVLAMAVAILGTWGLDAAGLIAVTASPVLVPGFSWSGTLLGGLMLGIGMAWCGGCFSRQLADLGGGSLRALVVLLVAGLSAALIAVGPLSDFRQALEAGTQVALARAGIEGQSLAQIYAKGRLLPVDDVKLPVALWAAGFLLLYCFANGRFRRARGDLLAGVMVGLLVTAGWAATSLIGGGQTPPGSINLVLPVADLVRTITGSGEAGSGFGVGCALGITLGALPVALVRLRLKLDGFEDTADLGRHLMGAALMGIGGVLAGGCSIGQGITGLSVLALGALAALIGMLFGALIGVRKLDALAEPEAEPPARESTPSSP